MLAPNHKPHIKPEDQPVTAHDIRHWVPLLCALIGGTVAGTGMLYDRWQQAAVTQGRFEDYRANTDKQIELLTQRVDQLEIDSAKHTALLERIDQAVESGHR